MNAAELEALNRCKGRVLDVGAGAGCHALALQQRGMDVLALERSTLSCEVIRARGVRKVGEADVMSLSGQQFDTILLLMNGFGIAGTEDGLVGLLGHLKTLLAPGGRILGDSTDIRYFKEESATLDLSAGSPCEVEFEVRCDRKTQVFPWIYPDEVLLEVLAEEAGLQYQTVMHTDDYHFLCELYV
jgi:SAM-dependent methyltransferase